MKIRQQKTNPPQILTLYAERIFIYYPKNASNEDAPYCVNTQNRFAFRKVVKQASDFDECPLYHQIVWSDTFKKAKIDINASDEWLKDILVILDFSDVFKNNIPWEDDGKGAGKKADEKGAGKDDEKTSKKKILHEKARDLMEKGLDIQFTSHCIHMVPFDKSGNMSRQSRITFINDAYYNELNDRLNLGIDFSKQKVILSKYYAYRGLYLTSSKRVTSEKIKLTPETIVVIKDKRMSTSGKKRELLGKACEKEVPVITAEEGEIDPTTNTRVWNFTEEVVEDTVDVPTPFDGVGMISPGYATAINDALGIEGATSFQVRLPFVKGMLHQVDFIEFLREFDPEGMEKDTYEYEDAFKIKRDLKKAKILITESMFKGIKWIKKHCDDNGIDPMNYYCEALEKYKHAFYVSGTDLPYGHTEYTHLSYQMLNTLALNDEQFSSLYKKHEALVQDPLRYADGWDSSEAYNYDETEISYELPVWKRAVKEKPDLKDEKYIESQLSNLQKGLITNIAKGKLVVAGQTRYLCRDLMPLLASLLYNPRDVGRFYKRCLFFKFYLPTDNKTAASLKKYKNLDYSGFCAFFRNPHLSRNEQGLLQPFVSPKEGENFFKTDDMPSQDKYEKYIRMYHKYFGHLTGVVMVPRGSTVPLCLGGADFDGDLVSIVYDEDIVKAVQAGGYSDWLYRDLPLIKIPSLKKPDEDEPKDKAERDEMNEPDDPDACEVPKFVPFEHIRDTFSNCIGYLSNSAISIGQKEYDSEERDNFDENGPTCWKCTILTGLEIDSAKNGIHPNINMIVANKDKFPKAPYLKFNKAYEKLRKRPSYRFDSIKITEKQEKNGDICFEISNSDPKKPIKYLESYGDKGTKINQLPILFCRAYQDYQDEHNKIKKNVPLIDTKKKVQSSLREEKAVYEDHCKSVMELYIKYQKLAKEIRKEQNKDSEGQKNMEKLIARVYDSENEAYINTEVLTTLKEKLDKTIPQDNTEVREIKARMNALKWQFQPYENREETLENVIGNGFSANVLDKVEKDLLFHFNQNGYKLLWHLLTAVEESRIRSYEQIKADLKMEEPLQNSLPSLAERLDNVTNQFYDIQLTDVDGRLYRICLEELQVIMGCSFLPQDVKVKSLYKITKGSLTKAKFFWDSITWDDLEPYLKVGKEEKLDAE